MFMWHELFPHDDDDDDGSSTFLACIGNLLLAKIDTLISCSKRKFPSFRAAAKFLLGNEGALELRLLAPSRLTIIILDISLWPLRPNGSRFSIAAPHHAYFDNSSTSSALEALAMQAAKRSRTMQMAEKQLFDHQQFFQQQQMQQAALRHYQQSYYRPDLRISSFQQITPPESLAFWQQQQQQQQQMMCRSACCTSNTSTSFKYSPPSMAAPAMCCYPMPPTPMVTNNNTAAPNAGFCLGCAQGKCQQVNKQKNNLGIMRSL